MNTIRVVGHSLPGHNDVKNLRKATLLHQKQSNKSNAIQERETSEERRRKEHREIQIWRFEMSSSVASDDSSAPAEDLELRRRRGQQDQDQTQVDPKEFRLTFENIDYLFVLLAAIIAYPLI